MRINEIFYSLQGEGFFTGTTAVFIRFSGCNLQCDFCDTTHQSFTDMSEDEIVQQAANYAGRHVVITGGEPSLQLTASLVDKLHAAGKFVAIETNGTHPLPHNIDWITLSPKDAYVAHGAKIVLSRCHEIKLVYDGRPLPSYPQIEVSHRFLQPCDTGNAEKNRQILAETIDYCMQHPEWRLSLQTHKLTNIR